MTKFFHSGSEFRNWLEQHHKKSSELWLGFYKKTSGKAGITYPEALDEALCFGWIDGVRKSIDDGRYMIRFSPRRTRSIWSRVNIKRATELKKLGRMQPSGLKTFEAMDPKRSYSFENAPRKLNIAAEKRFRANKKAWDFFQAQPSGYQRTASFWVMSAKKEETRQRRLARLIALCQKKLRLGIVTGANKDAIS